MPRTEGLPDSRRAWHSARRVVVVGGVTTLAGEGAVLWALNSQSDAASWFLLLFALYTVPAAGVLLLGLAQGYRALWRDESLRDARNIAFAVAGTVILLPATIVVAFVLWILYA